MYKLHIPSDVPLGKLLCRWFDTEKEKKKSEDPKMQYIINCFRERKIL